MTKRLDHLVYAAPDLRAGVNALESALGIRASPGGVHPAWGTRNALIALGEDRFLEVIGPDPDQPDRPGPPLFGIDRLTSPTLVTWAVKGVHLDRFVADARAQGIGLGDVVSGRRVRSDGLVLSWRLTDPHATIADGIVPFVIDWGTTPHPARTSARGAALIDLRAEHPDPDRVRRVLDALGIELSVARGAQPSLIATIDCPRGRVIIR